MEEDGDEEEIFRMGWLAKEAANLMDFDCPSGATS